MKAILRFTPDGRIKAVWSDSLSKFFERAFGPGFAKSRRRASLIMTVEEGPAAGLFFADMTYLAEQTGLDEHRVCLWPPRKLEEECKKDEVAYVEEFFVRGGLPCDTSSDSGPGSGAGAT